MVGPNKGGRYKCWVIKAEPKTATPEFLPASQNSCSSSAASASSDGVLLLLLFVQFGLAHSRKASQVPQLAEGTKKKKGLRAVYPQLVFFNLDSVPYLCIYSRVARNSFSPALAIGWRPRWADELSLTGSATTPSSSCLPPLGGHATLPQLLGQGRLGQPDPN